jgi:hypothetical protein
MIALCWKSAQTARPWAILDREPLTRRGDGRIVLRGDACHPMTPYIQQRADEDTSWLYGYDARNVPLTCAKPFVKSVYDHPDCNRTKLRWAPDEVFFSHYAGSG